MFNSACNVLKELSGAVGLGSVERLIHEQEFTPSWGEDSGQKEKCSIKDVWHMMATASNWTKMSDGVCEEGPDSAAEPSTLGLLCQA